MFMALKRKELLTRFKAKAKEEKRKPQFSLNKKKKTFSKWFHGPKGAELF